MGHFSQKKIRLRKFCGRSNGLCQTYPGQAGEMPDQVRHDVGSEAGADADLGDALHTETQLHETVDYLTHLQADE